MKKVLDKYLNSTIICPVCKQKRKGAEMMCGVEMCKHCYSKKRSDNNAE